MAKCWKVGRLDERGRVWSAFVPRRNAAVCLRYAIGETTASRFGGSFCFSSLNAARAFVQDSLYASLAVFRAKGRGRLPLPDDSPEMGMCDDPARKLRRVWKQGRAQSVGSWPVGTVAYREVTLVRHVWPKPKGAE